MDFQSFNEIMVCDDAIANVRIEGNILGYQFEIRYPSYRGTFLSCIELLEFEVDGVPVPKEKIVLILNGKQFLLNELPELFKEYWFILTPATVRVFQAEGLAEGPHSVKVHMRHRIPYTGYFGQYLVLDSRAAKTLEVKQ